MEFYLKDQLSFLLTLLSLLFIGKSPVLKKFAFVVKQNQILMRTVNKNQIKYYTTDYDRFFFHQIIADEANKRIGKFLCIVTPKTVLSKWKDIIKKRNSYPNKRKPGRPRISNSVRKLIIEIKQKNPGYGYDKIAGVLKNIGINVSKSFIARFLQTARKTGDIIPIGSWKKFIKAHFKSLFCCDFFTVETVFQSRIFIFFILELKTRKIVNYGLTSNPNLGFVRNQLSSFMYDREEKETFLIHDNSGELKWFDYESLNIKDIAITPYSPNMNAFAERFVRSAKNECMDHFVVFNKSQLKNLMKEYVKYYNTLRPHWGIDNKIPDSPIQKKGNIRGRPVLFGLYHHYEREAS